MSRFAIRRAAIGAALLTLTGCTSTVAGQSSAQPALWDPCTIPSDALAAAGVDPTIRDGGALDLDDSEWDECVYKQDWYYVLVQATVVPFQQILDDPRSEGFESISIDGRHGVTFHRTGENSSDACKLSLPYSQGSIVIAVDKAGDEPRDGDACINVSRITSALADQLPE